MEPVGRQTRSVTGRRGRDVRQIFKMRMTAMEKKDRKENKKKGKE
jgi:hypothetical protein